MRLRLHGGQRTKTRLERKLADIVIPVFECRDTPALDAFQLFVRQCLKSDPDGEYIRLAFDLNVLNNPDRKLADEKITISLKDMPAKDVLEYLLALLNLQTDFHESFILIRQTTG